VIQKGDLPVGAKQELLTVTRTAVVDALHQQHPIHGIIGEIFEDLGGHRGLLECAQENPKWFYTNMFKTVPNMAPLQGMQGDINLTINNNLIPTALDD
jgi:hypothetical protein